MLAVDELAREAAGRGELLKSQRLLVDVLQMRAEVPLERARRRPRTERFMTRNAPSEPAVLLCPLRSSSRMAAPSALAEPGPSRLTAQEEDALKASTFQRLYPRVYLERFLSEGVRPDGRTTDAFRDITVNVGQSLPHFSVCCDLKP